MKKLIIGTLFACMSMATLAAGDTYQVYKFQFSVKTSDAKGVAASACGCENYCYREKRAVTVYGLLAGCGCEAINANGTCSNAILYMWDATRKIAITNVEVTIPWTVQRVGKKLNVVEHFAGFKCTYGEDDRYGFDIVLAGHGSYADYKKDPNLSYVPSITGTFAGIGLTPFYTTADKVSACEVQFGSTYLSQAFKTCESCSEEGLLESEHADKVPVYGSYYVKYDGSRSRSASKKGLTAKTFNLPSYVGIYDYIATNIGED